MKLKVLLGAAVILLAVPSVLAQVTTDVIGMHDLSPGGPSPIRGARPGSCTYCHAPHSGLASGRALWNQQLTKTVYNLYTSPSYVTKGEQGRQPTIGSDSNLCLSCHDGTVAVGNTIVSGQVTTMGQMNATDQFLPNKYDPPAFALRLAHKDVSLATGLGRELNVPMRLANLALADLAEGLNRGWGDRDSRSIMLCQLERAGVEIEVDTTPDPTD